MVRHSNNLSSQTVQPPKGFHENQTSLSALNHHSATGDKRQGSDKNFTNVNVGSGSAWKKTPALVKERSDVPSDEYEQGTSTCIPHKCGPVVHGLETILPREGDDSRTVAQISKAGVADDESSHAKSKEGGTSTMFPRLGHDFEIEEGLEPVRDNKDYGTWESDDILSIHTSRQEVRGDVSKAKFDHSCSHVTVIDGSSLSKTSIPCFVQSQGVDFLALGQNATGTPPPSSQPTSDISTTVDMTPSTPKISAFRKQLEKEQESAPSTEKPLGSVPGKDSNSAGKFDSVEQEIQTVVIAEVKPNCIKPNDAQYPLVQSIGKLYKEEFNGIFEQQISKKGGWRLSCLSDTFNSLLAFIIWRVEGKSLLVGNLAVPKEQRRKGYGKQMIRHIIQWGRKNTHCSCCALYSMPNAVKFYLRIGFRIWDTKEKIMMWRKVMAGKVSEHPESSSEMPSRQFSVASTSGEKHNISSAASTASEETRIPDEETRIPDNPDDVHLVGQLHMTLTMKKKK